MRAWLIALLAGLLAAGMALGWASTSGKLHAAQHEISALRAVSQIGDAVAVKSVSRASATQKKHEKQDATIAKVVQSAPVWATEPLPPGVADALR
jgi:hypothetical protein